MATKQIDLLTASVNEIADALAMSLKPAQIDELIKVLSAGRRPAGQPVTVSDTDQKMSGLERFTRNAIKAGLQRAKAGAAGEKASAGGEPVVEMVDSFFRPRKGTHAARLRYQQQQQAEAAEKAAKRKPRFEDFQPDSI